MNLLIQVLAFIITILVLVSFHEAGHFLVAKWLGIKVLRFSIGFGKPFLKFHDKHNTEYFLAYIPLGGYVKLLDEREGIVPDSEKHLAFNRQPLWSRTLVIIAGPLTNLLFAILGFWILYMVGVNSLRPIVDSIQPSSIAAQAGVKPGDLIDEVDGSATPNLSKLIMAIISRVGDKDEMSIMATNHYSHQKNTYHLNLASWKINSLNPDPLSSLGIALLEPEVPPTIKEVVANSPAANAGIKPFDKILSVNNLSIQDWQQFAKFTHKHPGDKIILTLQRNHAVLSTSLVVGSKWGAGFVGAEPMPIKIPPYMMVMIKYPPFQALGAAIKETWQLFAFNFVILKKMILGKISLGGLGGPITIYKSADIALKQGLPTFLGFLSLISIMLAFINILPIPGLDGGHLLNNLIEYIIRRPLPLKFQLISVQIGIFILVFIMFIATINDVVRIWIALHR
jgi:regulator of sigma E protease